MAKLRRLASNDATQEEVTPAGSSAETPTPLPDDLELVADIAAAIDGRLASLGAAGASRHNVSFIINCRGHVKAQRWDFRRQRRVCAGLERKYIDAGWKEASIYVMQNGHLRLRVTLRAHAAWERRPSRRPRPDS